MPLFCFLYIFYHASFRIQSYHSPNQTMIAENGFFSKINSFLAATARSIYSSNFSHILKHSESRGNTPIKSRCFKIDSTLQGRGFSVLLLNHYVSRPKKRLTTSVQYCYKASSTNGLVNSFLISIFLKEKRLHTQAPTLNISSNYKKS